MSSASSESVESNEFDQGDSKRILNLISREKKLRERLQSSQWRPPNFMKDKPSEFMAPVLFQAIEREDMSRFLSIVEELSLMYGLYVSDIVKKATRGGNTILHVAVQNRSSNILNLMTYHFPKLILRRNITGDTALHLAARNKDDRLVYIILNSIPPGREGFQIKIKLLKKKNKFGNTALHEAVIARNRQGTILLLREGPAMVNVQNNEGKSPVYLSVETEEAHDFLLSTSLRWSRKKHQGTSPLHAAIMAMSSGQISKHIFQSMAGLMRHRSEEGGPMQANRRPITRRKSQYLDVERWGASDITKGQPITNYCEKILSYDGLPLIYLKDQKGGMPLHFAASMGNIEAVLTILAACPPSALEWDLKGRLPIHIACKKGHVNVVKEFVENGAEAPWLDCMELLNKKGQNILHVAAKNGKDKVVKYILKEKKLEKLLNKRDNNGNTPLHLASKYLHPKILLVLTQEKRVNINLVNSQGMTARDIVLLRRGTPPTFRENLSFTILKSMGIPLSEHGRGIRHSQTEPLPIEWIKDRVNIILVVAILIATVTLAAGFTIPGGVNSPDYIDPKKKGMVTLVDTKWFKAFTICDVIAMYSSTMGSFILLWAQQSNSHHIAFKATHFTLYLVFLALIAMSIAFMAAVHLVVGNVPWLADIVLVIGIIFLLMFLSAFILLIFPLGKRALFFGHISDFMFKIIIPLSGSYGKLPKMKALKETEKDEDKDESQLRREKETENDNDKDDSEQEQAEGTENEEGTENDNDKDDSEQEQAEGTENSEQEKAEGTENEEGTEKDNDKDDSEQEQAERTENDNDKDDSELRREEGAEKAEDKREMLVRLHTF